MAIESVATATFPPVPVLGKFHDAGLQVIAPADSRTSIQTGKHAVDSAIAILRSTIVNDDDMSTETDAQLWGVVMLLETGSGVLSAAEDRLELSAHREVQA